MLSDHNDKKWGPFTFSWNGLSHLLLSIENDDEYGAKINCFTPWFLLTVKTPPALTVSSGHEYGIRITEMSIHLIRQTSKWEDDGPSWIYPWKNLYSLRNDVFPEVETFKVRDYDGTVVTVTTQVREDEYVQGPSRGFWSFVGKLRRTRINRWMDIQFDREVGPEKGSWKGGMIGHSIDIVVGETMRAAMERYCDQEQSHRGQKYKLELLA